MTHPTGSSCQLGNASSGRLRVEHGLTGRSRSDHVMQLQYDIATYFGYNTFLVGKLMKLFPADEVSSLFDVSTSAGVLV